MDRASEKEKKKKQNQHTLNHVSQNANAEGKKTRRISNARITHKIQVFELKSNTKKKERENSKQ